MTFAQPPAYLNATKYTGDQISDVPCVDRPRAPTVTDINYPILTLWRNGDTNAVSPNAFGDLWYLAYFIGQTGTSYLAHWIKLSGGGGGFGPLVEINVPFGVTPIQPDGIGAITFTSTGGTVAITGSSANPNNHNINFDLTGGGLAVDSFTVQAATAPGLTTVTPDGLGNVVVNGNPVVNHLVPVETRSRALNSYNVEVQYANSNAGALATKSGLAHFDSSSFTVDPNTGYVTLAGGGLAVDSFQVQDVFAPGVQPVAPTGAGLITFNGAAVANHSVVLETSTRALNTMNVEIQYATTAAATDATKSGVAHFKDTQFTVDANGFVQLTGGNGPAVETLTPDFDFDGSAATPVEPQTGNINVLSYNPSVANVTNTYNSTGASTGNLQVEHKAWLTALVVDPSTTIGSRGTFSTIASALTAASSGQTIFIRPGTYTENLTLKAGVNLSSFESSSSLNGTGQVVISGTCTMTTAGSVTISGIQLQTNGAALLAVTGSAASIVNLNNCFLNCTNATGITFSAANTSSAINISNCNGDIGTTGIALIAHSSTGGFLMSYSVIDNSGSTLTANTMSSGFFTLKHSQINMACTSSATGSIGLFFSTVDTNSLNITSITVGGSGSHVFVTSQLYSGSASTISIGGGGVGVNMHDCSVSSDNTNCITGAGTLAYSAMKFLGTSSTMNVTTQSGGTLVGSKFQAPSVGFLGEQIRSMVLDSAPVSIVNLTAKTITSISVTPGVWDLTALAGMQSATTGTFFAVGIGTTTDSFAGQVNADSVVQTPTMSTATTPVNLVVPNFRVVLTATTTYYMVAQGDFTIGAPTVYGRLTAVRVA